MPTGIRGGSSPHDSFFAPYSATIFTGKFHCDLVRGIAPQPTPHLAKDVEIVVISELAPGDCPHHHITIWAHGFRVWGQSTACRFRIHDGECPQTSIVHQCPQIVNANPFLLISPLRAAAPGEPHTKRDFHCCLWTMMALRVCEQSKNVEFPTPAFE